MNDTTQTEAPKAKRPAPEVTKVTMTDGRETSFTGKIKLNREIVEQDGQPVAVRFDFKNGETRSFDFTKSPLLAMFAAHGAKQKIGDETAGEEDVDDMVVAVDAILERLANGDWGKVRASGDGFSGASVVIRAVMEVSGKTQEQVKAFLDAKLAADSSLKRKDLYDSFRKPGSKTGDIILRLENEKKAKAAKFDGDALAAELGAVG